MKVKKKNRWLRWINMWPPLLGAGIRVTRMDDDMRAIDVEMKLTKLNRNYVGTHYGGSLYSMADPFYMLMLMANLGRDYIVWDKAATIRFKKPGRGTVHAEFRLSDRQVQDIREQLKTHHKIEPMFTVEIKAADGEVVAEIDKLLYVRKK